MVTPRRVRGEPQARSQEVHPPRREVVGVVARPGTFWPGKRLKGQGRVLGLVDPIPQSLLWEIPLRHRNPHHGVGDRRPPGGLRGRNPQDSEYHKGSTTV